MKKKGTQYFFFLYIHIKKKVTQCFTEYFTELHRVLKKSNIRDISHLIKRIHI